MRVTPLGTLSPGRVRDALVEHGWDSAQAIAAAEGANPGAVHAVGLDHGTLERLVVHGGKLGLEVLTGSDWAVITGSQARLSALARPWGGPEELAELAHALGLALPAAAPASWPLKERSIPLDEPVLSGILNVTPDSFSDGGRYHDLGSAIEHARGMSTAGAKIIDVGGESTRPGVSEPVSVSEELERVLPVVEALREQLPEVIVSVDTVKAEVARRTLAAGASIINDVSAGRIDPELPGAVADADGAIILMHSRGPLTEIASYRHAEYGDLVAEVLDELSASIGGAVASGIPESRIAVDPGLGFGKRADQNWLLLDQLQAVSCLGKPVIVGPSRKRFLGAATGRPVDQRDTATAATCALAFARGARIFRVHDVAAARDALMVARAVSEPSGVSE